MERLVVCLIAVVVFAVSPAVIQAQTGLIPSVVRAQPEGLASPLSSFACGDLGRPGVTARLSGRAGQLLIGSNINFPIPFDPGSGIRPIDFQLRDANVWMGKVGLDVALGSRLALFLAAQGNLKRNVTLVSSQEPLGFGEVRWTGDSLEWWAVDGGGSLQACSGVSVVAGLRRDHFALGITDPRIEGFAIVPDALVNYAGDLQVKLWIPYIGAEWGGSNYRARLLWSPFPYGEIKMPVRVSFDLGDFNDLKYSLKRGGCVIEGDFEYTMPLGQDVAAGLWVNGSWIRIRGEGTEKFIETGILPLGPFAQDATSTYTRSMIGGGLSLQVGF